MKAIRKMYAVPYQLTDWLRALVNVCNFNRSIQAGQEDEPDPPVEADNTNAPTFKYNFRLRNPPRHPPEGKVDAKEASEPSSDPESSQKDTTPAPDESDLSASTDGDDSSNPETSKSPSKKSRSDNPIHWYGILVPPSLRTAQNSFTDAVQDSVPELAGTVVKMRKLEERITQVRAEIEGQSTKEASPK